MLDLDGRFTSLPIEVIVKASMPSEGGHIFYQMYGPSGTGTYIAFGLFPSSPYYLELDFTNDAGDIFEGDTFDLPPELDPDPDDGVMASPVWMRILIEEAQMSAKVWLDGSEEPSSYQYVIASPTGDFTADLDLLETLEVSASGRVGDPIAFDEITFVSGLTGTGGGP